MSTTGAQAATFGGESDKAACDDSLFAPRLRQLAALVRTLESVADEAAAARSVRVAARRARLRADGIEAAWAADEEAAGAPLVAACDALIAGPPVSPRPRPQRRPLSPSSHAHPSASGRPFVAATRVRAAFPTIYDP